MELTLTDMGPHQTLVLELQPGINRLTGCNGAGKSEAIQATAVALGGDGKVEHRDGAEKGTVTSGGAVLLRVGARQSKSGRPDVELADAGGLHQIVDPGIKDPEKADAARVKAILSLVPVHVTLEMEHLLSGGDASLLPRSRDGGILGVAEGIRRSANERAMEAEKSATVLEGEIRAAIAFRDSITGEENEEDPQRMKELASRRHEEATRLKVLAEQRAAQEEQIAEIRSTLGARPDVDAQDRQVVELFTKMSVIGEEVAKCQQALRVAEQRMQDLAAVYRESVTEFDRLRKAAKLWDTQHDLVEKPVVGPSREDADTAQHVARNASLAHEAAERGAKRRDVVKRIETLMAERGKATAAAASLRDVAQSLSYRLGDILSKHGLAGVTIQEGRLLVQDVRFADRMSLGQRVKFALDIYLLGAPGKVVPLDPGFWASLQPKVQREIHEHALKVGAYLVTEQPTDEDGVVVRHGVE